LSQLVERHPMQAQVYRSSGQVKPARFGIVLRGIAFLTLWLLLSLTAHAALRDFGGDNKSDLLLTDGSGQIDSLQMNGLAITTRTTLLAANSGWRVIFTADFNGDGKADLLWQHADGAVALWLMNGANTTGTASLLGTNSGWRVIQVADFNGDSKADLVWQHADGSVALWLMNGTALQSSAGLLGANSGWRVIHTADLNGDGKADLVWQHTDGSTGAWLMNGTALQSSAGLLGANSGWRITHAADLDGDGKADLVWQHTDGSTAVWRMNGAALQSSGGLLGANSGWRITHAADLNGDGKADLVWQHTDGTVVAWLMNGVAMQSSTTLLSGSAGWRVVDTADFNGDGKADLLWQHADGTINIWLMNGLTMTSGGTVVGPGGSRIVINISMIDDPVTAEEFNGPFSSWKNVKIDFGAKGDGVTDDTAAIQNALNALKTVATNNWNTLYFPPGNYRITSQLTTSRIGHDDYFGAQLIGDNPLTTTLVWDGPADGTMLLWDAWYDKVSRLGFDGKAKAANGLLRRGSFATYGELSDLQFKDISGACIYLSDGQGAGIAEQAVLRNRFYRCGSAIALWNYNTLDIYIWYNYFEDNNTSIITATGTFHAYENRFVRSKNTDLRFGSSQLGSIVNNVSLGSASFLTGDGNAHAQGNKVYGTTGIPFTLVPYTALIDNVIQPAPGVWAMQLLNSAALVTGNTFITNLKWPIRMPLGRFDHGDASDAGHPINDAVDGNPDTYSSNYLYPEGGIQWNTPFGTKATVTRYAITSGLNNQRGSLDDPVDFSLLGSNDWGATWITLDTRTNQSFSARKLRKEFVVTTPGSYSLYKLRVDRTLGAMWLGLGELELLDVAGVNIARDPGGLVLGVNEEWGALFMDQQTILPPGSVSIPTSLQPWDFTPKVSRKIIEPTDFTGAAVQAAINLAALEPAGSRPVVHLRKGAYNVASTITVPANAEFSIAGDGASNNGARLRWFTSSPVAGPVMRLAGPSRALLRDLVITGNAANGVGAMIINNADQPGGRVYCNQVYATGPGADVRAGMAFDINGVEQSNVTMTAFGMQSFLNGIRVSGGPLRAAGQQPPGRVDFLTGASSDGNRNYDVRNGGALVATAVWYEGEWNYQAPLVDLTSQSSGSLTLATLMISATMPTLPVIRTSGFNGNFALLTSNIDHRNSTHLDFTGDGSKTKVFGALNMYALLTDPNKNKPISEIWNDTTAPAGQVSHIASEYSSYTNKVIGAQPSAAFVQDQIARLRGINTEPANNRAPGVTDVKLMRVILNAGAGTTALQITSGN
jgi:Pectate lyase superfamily protein/FG-GAP-like repeat